MIDQLARRRWLPWAAAGLLCVIAFALRLAVFNLSAYGDEMSTLWIVKKNFVGGVISAVNSDAEISPPFYFLLAKAVTVFGQTVSAIRLPSLVSGMLVLPLYFLLAVKLLGRRAAWYTLAIVSVSPLLVSISATARAYSVMVLMVVLSALVLVYATSDNGRWWHWLGFSVTAALAVY
ncbi:MAG: glycosyltransferase family 39 protein, partial [Solirubrobacterales bacterium]|nr:glycosyltransferase family 39 protein [Solirubrobacterales bacterium]